IHLPLADHTEIAGAEQAHQLVLLVLLVQRVQHLETGETQVLQCCRIDIEIAEVEHFRVVADFVDAGGGDLVDLHRYVEMHALMVKTQLKRCFSVTPVALLIIKAQLLIIAEGHLPKDRGQVALRRLIRSGGQFLGLAGNIVEAERPAVANDERHAQGQQIPQHLAASASVRSSIESGKHGASYLYEWLAGLCLLAFLGLLPTQMIPRKSTRLNSSHVKISYAVFCLKKKSRKM